MADLQKSLKALKRTVNTVYPGSLGASPSVVNVPNRLGFSYVRLLGNTSELIQAYNTTVAAQYDVPVQVQWDGKKYVVIGRDINRYASWNASAYLPTHGDTHQFGGGDTTWVLQEQFYPLAVSPSGTSLYVAPYVYNWNGAWKSAGGVTVSGITLPTDPTKQKIMLLYMDGATATPTWSVGTEAPLYTDKNLLIPYLPAFSTMLGMPLAMVRIPSGTTSLGWSNLYDVRQFFGGGNVSGSSTTGSNYTLPTASASVLGGVKIGSRLTMTGDTLSADVQSGTSLPTGSNSILGGFRVGQGVYVNPDGTLNSSGTNYSLPTGSASVLGGFRVGSGLSVSAGVLSATGGISGSSNSWNLLYSDNFSNLSNWTIVDGVWTVSGNILSKTDTSYAHIYLTNYPYIGQCIMECEFRCTSASLSQNDHIGLMWCWQGAGSNAPNGTYCYFDFRSDGTMWINFEEAGTTLWGLIQVGNWSQNTWYKLRVVWNGFVYQAYLNDVLSFAIHADQGVAEPLYIGLRSGDDPSSGTVQAQNFKTWVPVLP
jgi:hypothetical protein